MVAEENKGGKNRNVEKKNRYGIKYEKNMDIRKKKGRIVSRISVQREKKKLGTQGKTGQKRKTEKGK